MAPQSILLAVRIQARVPGSLFVTTVAPCVERQPPYSSRAPVTGDLSRWRRDSWMTSVGAFVTIFSVESFCREETARLKCFERNGTSRETTSREDHRARERRVVDFGYEPPFFVGRLGARRLTTPRGGAPASARAADRFPQPRFTPSSPPVAPFARRSTARVVPRPGRGVAGTAAAHGADDLLNATIVPRSSMRVGLL